MQSRNRSLVVLFGSLASLYLGCAADQEALENQPELASGEEVQGDDGDLRWRRRDAGSADAAVDAGRDAAVPVDAAVDAAVGVDAGRDAAVDASAPLDASAPVDSGSPALDAGGSASSRWVSGYYAAYQRSMLPPDQIDWSGLTHIIFTRLKTSGGGHVQLDFDIDTVNGPALARDVAQRAHAAGKKAILMLGGMAEGAGIRNSASAANRATFVSELLDAVNNLGYDGLDLDWEDDIVMDDFIALARDLRASPKAKPGLLLTVPGMAVNGNYQTLDPKIATLVQYLNQYSLMSYYPSTAMAGWGWLSWHNTPLSGLKSSTPVTIEDSMARHVALGIPKEKLGIGIGFYAICYTGGVTAPNQSTENGVTIQGGDNDFPLSRLFANGGVYNAAYRRWDSAAQVPYLSLPSAESHGCRYVSYDDAESLVAKGNFVKSKGYGGAIVWTINQGWLTNSSMAPNTLMQALKRGFLDP